MGKNIEEKRNNGTNGTNKVKNGSELFFKNKKVLTRDFSNATLSRSYQ